MEGVFLFGVLLPVLNMKELNGNVGQIAKDLNVLTHNVAPAMKGMRNMMPWVP